VTNPLPQHIQPLAHSPLPSNPHADMSDDEADPELLALLRQSLGLGPPSASSPPETKVLQSAEHVYNNAIDVAISSSNTKAAASRIWTLMQQQSFSTQSWSKHELHPKGKDEKTVDFIFTMDLLNFCFWSENEPARYEVEYNGREWSGYWSMVAALRRALDEGKSDIFVRDCISPCGLRLSS
jgi:hypothetical protein